MLGHPGAVALVRDALGERGEIVLAVGLLDVGEKLGPFARKVATPAQEIARGAHLPRVDVGHGDVSAAQEYGDLVRIDPVVFGLPAVYGFHVEGMSEHEGDLLLDAQVG